MLFGLLIVVGFAAHASDAGSESLLCPSGMVLISGEATVGMRGQPYGVVETAHLDKVDAPEKGCEEAVRNTPGATACWVQTDLVDPVLAPRSVKLASFCIEQFPFPGAGSAYSEDGLNVWTASQLNEMLKSGQFGRRRLCTASEFQVAVAGPKTNQRFVYGDEFTEGRCDGDTIGFDRRCRNSETGVHEYAAVHSHWTIADKAFVDSACRQEACLAAGNRPLRVGMYVVMGGTKRAQTRQAPHTPHTWHDHGDPTQDACGFVGWDDQPAICADPGMVDVGPESAWTNFVAKVRSTRSMTTALQAVTGKSICPN